MPNPMLQADVKIREALASPATPFWAHAVLTKMLTADSADMAGVLEWLAGLARERDEEVTRRHTP